jgi:DNA repair exonuclease SbcCD ATPase subunit
MHGRRLRRGDSGGDLEVILRSLRLENFRSFAQAELVFDERQNYVVGGNWQGKSSLVEGVAFALFGGDAFPRRLAGAPVKAEHLMTDGARTAGVELVFSVGDYEYTIKRQLPRPAVSLLRGGKQIASGKKPVEEKLRDLLSVDAKFFSNVFYADQDDLRKSFDLTPADRCLFIERLIGQEIWRDRVDGLRRAQKHLQGFLVDLATGRFGVFVRDLDQLGDEIRDAESQLRNLKTQAAVLARQVPRDRKGLRGAEEKVGGDIADLQHKATALDEERRLVDQLARALQKGKCPTCTQAVPISLRKSRVAVLRQRLRAIDSTLVDIQRDLSKLQRKLAEANFEEAHDRLDELNRLQEDHRLLSHEQERRVAREKNLRKQSRVFGKRPEQHGRATAELEFLGRLIDVIEDHRAALRGRVVAELVISMNELLARFYDGDFDAEAVIGTDLDLNVRLHGRDVPLTNLSGAAKDMFAIAFRYGLMRVAARHVDCLILDEPTRHMDPKNVRQLRSIFDDLADRQLLVVTIQEEFATARGRHFVVTKDSEFRSVVTAGL